MITLLEIAKELCVSYSRVAAIYKRAGVKPIGKTGRTLLFNEADISLIKDVLAKTPKRIKRSRTNNPSETTSGPSDAKNVDPTQS